MSEQKLQQEQTVDRQTFFQVISQMENKIKEQAEEINENHNKETERRRNFINCRYRRQNNKENKTRLKSQRENQHHHFLVRRAERDQEVNQHYLPLPMPVPTDTENNDFASRVMKFCANSGYTSSSNTSLSFSSDMSSASL